MLKKISTTLVLLAICGLTSQSVLAEESASTVKTPGKVTSERQRVDAEIEKLFNQAVEKANSGDVEAAIDLFAEAGKLVKVD